MNEEKDTQIVIESDPFSMLPNDFIRNPNISNDAKALFAIIKSYIGIPDFILYKTTLIKSFKGGDTKFRNAWKELKDTGYLCQIKINTSKGFIYKYKLTSKPDVQSPHVDNPHMVSPHVDSPQVENPHVGNQHSYKELLNNNDFNNIVSVSRNYTELNNMETETNLELNSILYRLNDEQYRAFEELLNKIQSNELPSSKDSLLRYFNELEKRGWKDGNGKPIKNIVGYVTMNFVAHMKDKQLAEKKLQEMGFEPGSSVFPYKKDWN